MGGGGERGGDRMGRGRMGGGKNGRGGEWETYCKLHELKFEGNLRGGDQGDL